MAPGLQISRNMIVVRSGTSLTLISTVRLNDAGLKALDALGQVEHVMKLGAFHLGDKNGLDDAFYVDRYDAQLWALPGMEHKDGLVTSDTLVVNGPLPIEDASLFVYETSKMPEGMILLQRGGGTLVSADSLQNWTEVDPFFSEEGGSKMQSFGFIKPANIGPQWRRVCEPQQKDFTRIAELPFRHLLPSHGKPILNTAKQQFLPALQQTFNE